MVKQQGFSMWGVLVGLVILAGVVTLGLRIGPLYIDNMKLDKAIESSARSNNFQNMSSAEIRDALSRTFRVNGVEVNPREFAIDRVGSGTELSYVHEERVNIVGNVDVIVTFTNRYNTADN